MKKIRLNCFIATAFDKKDVDSIYKNIIVPVLKKYSIVPLRVDKIEHNDDIDDKIFELLDKCDFCIADLTYARPSVYYEAGYAIGNQKSVIYTARKDHFKPQISDHEGNLRVHFDLQMKNIIPWSIPDKTFKLKLENRIRKIVLPIMRVKNTLNLLRENEVIFNKYSLIEKTELIINKAKNLLRARGFNFPKQKPGSVTSNKSFSCFKNTKIGDTKIYFFVDPSVTKKKLDYFNSFYEYASYGEKDLIKNVHIIFNTFRIIPNTRITESLGKFNQIEHKTYYCNQKEYADLKPQNIYMHFIDNIKSENHFITNFKNILNSKNFLKSIG